MISRIISLETILVYLQLLHHYGLYKTNYVKKFHELELQVPLVNVQVNNLMSSDHTKCVPTTTTKEFMWKF
jgi:hypothetical protein